MMEAGSSRDSAREYCDCKYYKWPNEKTSAVDPDPEGKHRKKLINFIFLKCWMSLVRSEVFCCSLDISKLYFLIKKIFHPYFFLLHFFVIKTLGPDWIRIHLKCWIQIQ
jgi:hypothetical protein